MASKRDQKKREKERKRKKTQRSAPSSTPRDPVFFAYEPNPRISRIRDGRYEGQVHDARTGRPAVPRYSRYIGARPQNARISFPGTLIPVSHFKPLVEGLIRRGELNPANVDETIEKLAGITTRLIPHFTTGLEEEYHEAILDHGDHFTPLIAIQKRIGDCTEWAAVFTAMARNCDLNARIEGDPKFYEEIQSDEKRGQYHVWPVVIKSSGERVKVHVPRPRSGPGGDIVLSTFPETDRHEFVLEAFHCMGSTCPKGQL